MLDAPTPEPITATTEKQLVRNLKSAPKYIHDLHPEATLEVRYKSSQNRHE